MKNIPTFQEFLNEGKISNAILTNIEKWYNAKSQNDKKIYVKILTNLIAAKSEDIEKILVNEKDPVDAMDKLMEL